MYKATFAYNPIEWSWSVNQLMPRLKRVVSTPMRFRRKVIGEEALSIFINVMYRVLRTGDKVTCTTSIFLSPTVVQIDVCIAHILQAERLHKLGSRDNEVLVNVALFGVQVSSSSSSYRLLQQGTWYAFQVLYPSTTSNGHQLCLKLQYYIYIYAPGNLATPSFNAKVF